MCCYVFCDLVFIWNYFPFWKTKRMHIWVSMSQSNLPSIRKYLISFHFYLGRLLNIRDESNVKIICKFNSVKCEIFGKYLLEYFVGAFMVLYNRTPCYFVSMHLFLCKSSFTVFSEYMFSVSVSSSIWMHGCAKLFSNVLVSKKMYEKS